MRLLFCAGLLVILAIFGSVAVCAADDAWNGNQAALAALASTEDAISRITTASRLTVDDPDPYKQAARDVLQMLAGSDDPEHPNGKALGHLADLLSHAGGRPWQAVIEGAWANEMTAAAQLRQAMTAKTLDDYQSSMTQALLLLQVALGRDSGTGPLGGIEGALATTELGVPQSAFVTDGCKEPAKAPAYGVASGYLIYVAVPASAESARLQHWLGVHELEVRHGMAVLRTAASELEPSLCPGAKQADAGDIDPDPADPASASKLYTAAQARQGAAVFAQNCAVCHGAQMQGLGVAPPIAGTAYLKRAQALGWSVDDLRTVVVTTMPGSNPGSLSPQQYADVIAYLLASDCYPAGDAAFPIKSTPQIQKAKLLSPSGVKPSDPSLGTCAVPAK
ncbi:MAG: c-type cytochrome [Acetobacteraceae bacterium]|nr:c-type cytochrome [Acetobacteraceae bacterium]